MFRKRIVAACKAFLYPEIADIRDIATGALVKTEFLNASEKLLKRAQKDKRIFSLAFLDADGLKTINDAQGHKEGDRFIQRFSKAIFNNIRPFDLCSRWHGENGDEFILLLPGVSFDDAQKVICRIKQSFSFFSWGIIELTSADDLESAVQRAEELMYRHKRIKAGHNI